MNGDKRTNAKVSLCSNAARKISKVLMKDIKAAEEDIGSACMVYHQKYEKKLGRPIRTIQEFENATTEFSKLPRHEIEKLILEGKERAKKQIEMLRKL
jgi:hypothetical protein